MDLFFKNPYTIPAAFSFLVHFTNDEEDDGSFQEVSGLNVSIELETVAEGGLNEFAYKLPKGTRYENLVLKRGLFPGSRLLQWITDATERFYFKPRTVEISLLDNRAFKLVTWTLHNAYPVSYKVASFNAMENTLAFETLELAYSHFTRLG